MKSKKIMSLLTAMLLLVSPLSAFANTEPSGSKKYTIISNESIDNYQYQSSGDFTLNNEEYTFDRKLEPDAYKLDVNKSFDIQKNRGRLLNKRFSTSQPYQVGASKPFWVTDLSTNMPSKINATLSYSGTKANVWVHDSKISAADAEKLGREFDSKIYPSVTTNFAKESDVDRDGKINILCFDIQDGFDGTGGYVAGYFYGGDLFNVENSNLSEIFYIDTYPAMGVDTVDVSAAYTTLAHEFQHMVNFNQNVLIEDDYYMDTWLDEAMAMAAEQIYSGQGLSDRIDYYNYTDSISDGHSLLYWDDYGDTLANYSLSYLFGQYVKIQANQGNSIFKEILTDTNNDYKAVENAVKRHINPSLTFGTFMTDFRAALLLKQDTGLYGFKGDPLFDQLQPRLYTGTSAELLGGGAVIKENTMGSTDIPANKGTDVTYTFVSEADGPILLDTTPPQVYGVKNNGYYNKDVGITFNEGSATLNNVSFTSGTIVRNPGVHTLVVTDAEGKKNTVKFTIDKTAPKISGAINNGYYNKDVKITFNEGRATLNGRSFASGSVVKYAGVYTLVVTDPAGNKTILKFTIDKTAPKVSGASYNRFYNKDVKLTYNEGRAALNGRSFRSGSVVKYAGSYTLVVTDAAGNKTTLKFFIDKTRPRTPKVNTVKSSSRTVTGTAEAYGTVTVKAGSKTLGTAKADKYGKYKVTIKAQKKRTVLKITVKDRAGNISYTASKTVN